MPPSRAFDVVVVGGGVMGSSAARWLARRGRRVALLERFQIGHAHGSSHGSARIFRFSYPAPTYVAMAMEALPLWRELETESGRRLLTTTGGLDAGKRLDDHVAALGENGAPFAVLDGAEAGRRYPALSFSPDEPVLYQPDAGFVRAEPAWRTFAELASAGGAQVREGVRVVEVAPEGGAVTVRTADETYRAGTAIVTAGAWARGLLAQAGIDLPVRPTRETVGYWRLDARADVPTLVDWGDPSVYALPSPGDGLKAGEHQAGPAADPDSEGPPDESSLDRVAGWVATRYPSADPRPHRAETCLYTNTADERFVLERHGPIVVGSACSGHGFKFAPLIGRRLADLATG